MEQRKKTFGRTVELVCLDLLRGGMSEQNCRSRIPTRRREETQRPSTYMNKSCITQDDHLRELLAEDSVIFSSIDDNKHHRLRMMMDGFFGLRSSVGFLMARFCKLLKIK